MAQRTTDDEVAKFDNPLAIGDAVGLALHRHRIASGLSIRELGREAGISSAMISRIENAQVSPSLSTLETLANALSVPVISFFQHTIQAADIQFVKSGEGLVSKRFAPDHAHDYEALLHGASAAHNLPLPIDIAQAPASNSGRPSSVILFRMFTPILTSVF